MSIDLVKQLGLFIVMCAVQILILNHIHLFDVATPFLFVYFAISFRRNTPKWAVLLWCFAMGLAVDVFSNTPGLAAGSLTLVGLIQPYLLELFTPRDSIEDLECSAATLGMGKFALLSFILLFVFCLLFFALEAFTFFNWIYWLICTGSSTVLTLVLILAIESIRKK
jgi:rod shape-determining protein MreD